MRVWILLVVGSLLACGDRPSTTGEGAPRQPTPARRYVAPAHLGVRDYAWLQTYDPRLTIAARIAPPVGYRRETAPPGSFAEWLRHLPLRPGRPPVRLFDGRLKGNQSAHHAVVDLDTGRRNLQQCADAVMRLRAEYLFARGRLDAICFDYTSGDRVPFSRWARGERPVVRGNRVRWRGGGARGGDHASLRRYLRNIFTYAGTASLYRELSPVRPAELSIGDVFIKGGFPGHAVIVLDVAVHQRTGQKRFLIGQSYMPAQDFHLLAGPAGPGGSPWYPLPASGALRTPEWTFEAGRLRRF